MPGQHIACLWVPYFVTAVARQADRHLPDRPLVLLDEAGRVLAADEGATSRGIQSGQSERQVLLCCPDAILAPAARYPLWEAQDALWGQIRGRIDRWQPADPGRVYLDASAFVAVQRPGRGSGGKSATGDELLGWCQSMAVAVRHLGWEPALGVTGSKFGADVAGQVAGMNAALLVEPAVQRYFLSGRSVATLPLDPETLLQLRYLGIRTLGQFARLPATGVLVRFGTAGRTAQRWAQGLDDRPVIPPWEAPDVSARLEFDGPLADRERLLAQLWRSVERLLAPLQERLQAAGRIKLLVTRADRRVVPASYTFPVPTAASEAVRLGLAAALDRVVWDDQPATEITLTLADITDAPGQQLSLFDLGLDSRARLETTLRRLANRFSPDAFRLAVLADPDNPLPERRTSWRNFA